MIFQSSSVVSFVAALTLFNGIIMTVSPKWTMTKAYKFDMKRVDAMAIKQMIHMGILTIAFAVIMSLAGIVSGPDAVAYGLLIRLFALIIAAAADPGARSRFSKSLPLTFVFLACVVSILVNVGNPFLMSKVLAGLVWSMGVAFAVTPIQATKYLRGQDSSTSLMQIGLGRSCGKVEMNCGVLMASLACGSDHSTACAHACLSWITAIIYIDLIQQNPKNLGTQASSKWIEISLAATFVFLLLTGS